MPLELRKQRDGRARDAWYARYEIGGKRFVICLGVKVQGLPPDSLSLREKGDTAFECSRVAAQAKLNQIVEEARSKRGATHLVERLYEMKTGEKVRSVKLADVPKEWVGLPRRHKASDHYMGQSKVILGRFVSFMRAQYPKCVELTEVTRSMGRAFMEAEAGRGIAARTWNGMLMLLRSACRELLPEGALNPFAGLITKAGETVFRKPFTPEEMRTILEVAREDDFIRPLIVTGMCTALRRGDCCLLKWQDVDLARRFITVKTAKTGQRVSIPIFPLLYDELQGIAEGRAESRKQKVERDTSPRPSPLGGEGVLGAGTVGDGGRADGDTSPRPSPQNGEGVLRAGTVGDGGTRDRQVGGLPYSEGGYVFPKQAAMYLKNAGGITWRVKRVLRMALGGKTESGEQKAEMKLAEVPVEEARRRGVEFIVGAVEPGRKHRMLTVFEAYMAGKSASAAAAWAGLSKGAGLAYLNEIEGAVGCRIVRGRAGGCSLSAALRSDGSLLRVMRPGGVRKASVRDFHSFRVTWVTLALTAGVPLELVQKVTGHKTTDIVLKHYFQPGREDFRQALQSVMPKLLTVGSEKLKAETLKTETTVSAESAGKNAKEEMREMIAMVRPVALRERLLNAWAKL